MIMQKSTKNNKYKYNVGDYAFIVTDYKEIIEVEVIKRLKRPYRLSDNFYYCSWVYNGREKRGVRYEAEMYKDIDSAMMVLKNREVL